MTNVFWLTLPALVAAILAFALAPAVGRLAVWIGAVDMPGERKIHTRPIPRLGGLAVVVSIVAVFAGAAWLTKGRWQVPPELLPGLFFGIVPILFISLLDDIHPIRARVKFVAHTLGAAIAVWAGVTLAPVVHLFGSPISIGILAMPISVLWIVGVTNAFNIIDGLDGLSAGLALISAASMAAVFGLVEQPEMSGVALVLAGALVGFLPYNVHPARMFLGDTGATAIGFCLAAFALKGGSTLSSGFAAMLPVFILGLPIADTAIAMVRRSLRDGETPGAGMFSPDRNHIHHRLLALGVDHGRAVLILYAAGLLLAGAGLLSIFLKAREAALFVIAIVIAGSVGIQRLGYDEFAFIRRGSMLKMYEMPAVKRGMFVVFVDIFVAIFTAYVTVGMKTDLWSWTAVHKSVIDLASAFAPVTVLVFWLRGMYRGSWRVAGLQDLTRAASAVGLVTLVGGALVEVVSGGSHPLSVFAIYGAVNLLVTASLRVSYVVLEHERLRANNSGTPVLVYGAGGRGVAAVRELFQNPHAGLRPIGFIDDDAAKRGKLVSGLPVFGTQRELEGILRRENAEALLIATEKVPEERISSAADVCARVGASIFRLDITLHPLVESDPRAPSSLRQATVPADAMMSPAPVRAALSMNFLGPTGPEACPSCESHHVFRSKARTFYERLWKGRTDTRLFRCHACGWRGWLLPLEEVASGEVAATPDLAALDALFERHRGADVLSARVRDAS